MSEKASPKRIQKKNFYDYSWKSNPNAVYVGRPSRYGNPFKVSDHGLDKALFLYEMWLGHQLSKDPDFLEPLRGKDLVCFCPLDQRCHADILLKMANEVAEKLGEKMGNKCITIKGQQIASEADSLAFSGLRSAFLTKSRILRRVSMVARGRFFASVQNS